VLDQSLDLHTAHTPRVARTELAETIRRIARLKRARRRLSRATPPLMRLARVPDAAFSRLCAVLRGVHADGLASGELRYARMGAPAASVHYLLFDEARIDASRARRMVRDLEGVTWFESDRVVAAHYGPTTEWRPMVPKGTVLHPTPHSLDPSGFDPFFAKQIARWRAPARDAQGAPILPVGDDAPREAAGAARYAVFERPDPLGPLFVEVVPDRAFAPIEADVVAWLNDVQMVARAAPDAAVLSAAAAEATAARESEAWSAAAAQVRAVATRDLEAARIDVDARLRAFAREVTSALDALVAGFDGHAARIT
jgi:hypothetical protein